MSDGTVLITPAGAMKGFLSPEHMAHVDMQGRVLDNGPTARPRPASTSSATTSAPTCAPCCTAIPPHAVAMTIAGIDLQTPIIPEIIVTIGGIPTAPYGTPGTDELPESIRAIVRCSDTLVMQNHGSVTLGTNLLDAFKKLDMLEHTAKILWLAHSVGKVNRAAARGREEAARHAPSAGRDDDEHAREQLCSPGAGPRSTTAEQPVAANSPRTSNRGG
jgi:L-fuculose-phosphate aldolase